MIREIINFVKHLEEDYKDAFVLNKKPSPGLHLWIELENGKWKNNKPKQGEDYVIYDGKQELEGLLHDSIFYEQTQDRVTGNKLKRFDPKQKIHSSSPFAFAFNFRLGDKDKKNNNIPKTPKGNDYKKAVALKWDLVRLSSETYFKNSRKLIILDNDKKLIEASKHFEKVIPDVLDFIWELLQNKSKFIYTQKEGNYIRLYLRSAIINLDLQKSLHERLLMDKDSVFSKKEYTLETKDDFLGAPDFMTSYPEDKKPFMLHQTSFFKKRINTRTNVEDSWKLRLFNELKRNKVLPNPLPIFVDKNEFKNNAEFIRIFNEDGKRKFKYSELLKAFYDKNEQRVLANYYLLNTAGGVVLDFEFVSEFQYKIKNRRIHNFFCPNLRLGTRGRLDNIFQFEQILNRQFFKINNKTKKSVGFLSSNYFGKKIEAGKPFKGHTVDSDILRIFYKYRSAIYDYVYKSKQHMITNVIFDEIMIASIVSDIRHDEYLNNVNTKKISIQEKLNIWFSLSDLFYNISTKEKSNMASKLPDHRMKLEQIISNGSIIESDSDFAYVAGQMIYYLFSKGAGADKSFSRLEPFMQKSNCSEFINSIRQLFDMYKHENFTKKFSKVATQVFDYQTNCDLKAVLPDFLAGFFDENKLFSEKK